ncbi:hypothetical protein [Paracidovorax valerianellae]|uniref:Uncharacterized protein n=1 Tax=Paracidovorax valerianellae TaxID=187868 RepID=A0A1G6PAU1_9BURK|nr:hypothetical protein [Paracidovorax valerianellae]MDA8444830.1 hypothetical protein [Paracidovorax valerianellae]SDC77352.1 hypothetical protein SAMN05192589_103192 [Paracidovorax valerianellae]
MSEPRPSRKRKRSVRATELTVFDVKKVRRGMLWGVPYFMALIAGCYWMTTELLISTVVDIAYRAPAVQITPGALIAPFLATMLILGIVVGCMRTIPLRERIVKPFEYAMLLASLLGVAVMCLIPVAAVTLHFFMPSRGYYPCNFLQGSPNKWSNDWVRDPVWCVKGKTVEWVNEQARSATMPNATSAPMRP